MRYRVLDTIVSLGKQLQRYPVWARGGQPVPEYERQRPFTDVTAEWQNILTNLPQYEAWCRIQEQGRVGEYNAITLKAPDPPTDAAQIAHQLREQSSNRYGVDRSEIEQALLERIRVDGNGDDDDVPFSHRRDA